RGGLGRGQPRRQLRVGDIREPGLMRLLPGGQRVVEHHPCAAERPGQRLLLPWRRVETVTVPKTHIETIFDFMIKYSYIRTRSHSVSSRMPLGLRDQVCVTRYVSPTFTTVHLDRMEEICGTCPRTSVPGWLNEDSMMRSLFSVGSSIFHARSGSPSRFSSGTNTSSRNTSQEPRARMPSFGISRMVTPADAVGRMNSDTPWDGLATSLVVLTSSRM